MKSNGYNIEKTKEWICKFKTIYTDGEYTYDNFKYLSYDVKVIITCEIHGDFKTCINNFYHKKNKCGKCCGRNLTNQERINKCIEKHGYLYGYGKFNYKSAHEPVIITCKIHGDFKKRYNLHVDGVGCNKCKGYGLSREEHIEIFNKIHNYRYEYDRFEYNGMDKNSIMTCKIHGDFKQTPSTHRTTGGCGKCSGKGLTDEEHIEIFNKIHNYRYTYGKFKYIEAKENSIMTCEIHGDFKQSPSAHKKGQGCNKCNLSKGALKVMNYFDINGMQYDIEKKFEECRYKEKLPFDFYLPNSNLCIEYDGRQHFEPVSFGSKKDDCMKFEDTKRNDKIKNKYCKDNNIELIRIPYWDFDNIEKILSDKLCKN